MAMLYLTKSKKGFVGSVWKKEKLTPVISGKMKAIRYYFDKSNLKGIVYR